MLRSALWIVLAASTFLLSISVWILIPVSNGYLLPLAVGSPELSPVLLAAGVVLSAVAAGGARRFGTARLALVLAATAAFISLVPVVQVPFTLKRLDAAMARTTSAGQPRMRSRPFVLADMVRGIEIGDAHVTRSVEFSRPDGVPLILDVYQPTSSGSFPILVQIYGGSWQTGSPASQEWFARYFASRGYVVAAIDYRHAPRWQWPEQLEDVRSALRWIAENAQMFDGDPARIVLLGRSAGAQLAMRTAYQAGSSSIRGVVSYYGPVDLTDGWLHPPQPDPLNVRGVLEMFIGGTPAQMPDRYRHASPINYTTGPIPPTLLIYGGRDHIVEARFGRMLDAALRKNGTPSVLLEIPWAEHSFDAVPNGLGVQISLYYTERFIAWAVNR